MKDYLINLNNRKCQLRAKKRLNDGKPPTQESCQQRPPKSNCSASFLHSTKSTSLFPSLRRSRNFRSRRTPSRGSSSLSSKTWEFCHSLATTSRGSQVWKRFQPLSKNSGWATTRSKSWKVSHLWPNSSLCTWATTRSRVGMKSQSLRNCQSLRTCSCGATQFTAIAQPKIAKRWQPLSFSSAFPRLKTLMERWFQLLQEPLPRASTDRVVSQYLILLNQLV